MKRVDIITQSGEEHYFENSALFLQVDGIHTLVSNGKAFVGVFANVQSAVLNDIEEGN